MTVRLFLAAAGALTILAPAQAAQQQTKSPVVVTASAMTVNEWSARASKSLEGRLRYPAYLLNREPNEGVVRVRFRCSESGAPAAVTLARSSGHGELDRAALRAVRGIPTLHPLPAGITHDQQFQAVVLFATDRDHFDRQTKAINDEAARQNGRIAQGSQLAVSIGLLSAG
jgi:protein TonB